MDTAWKKEFKDSVGIPYDNNLMTESVSIPSGVTEYATMLTNKMATMNDIEDKDKKLIEAMILVDTDVFLESVKSIISNNLFELEKIVGFVNLANDCHIDSDKAKELINEEIESIKTKLANYFIENIPLTKRKTGAQDMRELMNALDITKIHPKHEEVPVVEKWYQKVLKKLKNLIHETSKPSS